MIRRSIPVTGTPSSMSRRAVPEPGASEALELPEWGSWIRFERVVPEKNSRREYAIAITQDLFGAWTLVRTWGRIGGQQRTKVTPFPDRDDAAVLAGRLARRRLSRGYRVTAFE